MRLIVQRVARAQVTIAGDIIGAIGRGICVLLGVHSTDTPARADYLAGKCLDLRIFPPVSAAPGELSVRDIGGGILVISQFTLYGDTKRGRRPSFTEAAAPALAEELYERFLARIRASGLPWGAGSFGAMMQVEIINDGPFTLLLER
ncbi:MAG: D-tyrosyl-tRNA(Tyr) deacylase [Cyanobacteria bacterium NC_groundwater_1444_Ag_S-0.65um_54_12]|nr:D-tyrosyl-tRNA(Tyr) deacylase [Cyanobacteria bacterium NC_groundwater_1444_Ag_S-0.65um_54_12]